MTGIILKYFTAILFVLIFVSCQPSQEPQKPKPYTKKQLDSLVIDMEQKYNRMEEDRIRDYISRHIPMQKSQMGYWYAITQKNPDGKPIGESSLVKYTRVVSLCNTKELYNDQIILKIGNGNEISGMHEALKMLRKGEKALFIFPSYLAHGLLGDMNKVPPKSELIYEVNILDVQ